MEDIPESFAQSPGDSQDGQTLGYHWECASRERLSPDDFISRVRDKFKRKDIVSVGEYHDLEQDRSYEMILQHQREILEAYDFYRLISEREDPQPFTTFNSLLRSDSKLFERLLQIPAMEQLVKMHVGRVFACGVLPTARLEGYTDLVLEGVDERNPARSLERSKDKIGDLLRITYGMMFGMRIHGAYPEGRFPSGADIADSLFDKIESVKRHRPDAKIITYNGAVHNMTVPFKEGTMVRELFQEYDASRLSYASRAQKAWGDKYGAIDLFNGDRSLAEAGGHFEFMRSSAEAGAITCFTHGVDQQSYVFK